MRPRAYGLEPRVLGNLRFEATALNNKQAFTLGLLTSLNGPLNSLSVFPTRCSGGAFANHTELPRTRASPHPHPTPFVVRDTVSLSVNFWVPRNTAFICGLSTPTHRLSQPYCCFVSNVLLASVPQTTLYREHIDGRQQRWRILLELHQLSMGVQERFLYLIVLVMVMPDPLLLWQLRPPLPPGNPDQHLTLVDPFPDLPSGGRMRMISWSPLSLQIGLKIS